MLIYLQTVFIISVCNNQLLHWIENELLWMPSFLPGYSSVIPNLITKLHSMKDKYLATKPVVPSEIEVFSISLSLIFSLPFLSSYISYSQGAKWDFSLAFVWNTVVWIMLLNFFVKIVNSTAQKHLKNQQDNEIAALKNKSSHSDD